jgi:UDP-N-acetylmuramoyl-tripeptide--D-alanyl-D-alanine ligase
MIAFALTAVGLWSTAKVTLRFLQFFQQEEYDSQRFLSWWTRSRSVEPRLALTAVASSALIAGWEWISPSSSWLGACAAGMLCLIVGLTIPTGSSKKPLKATARMQRLIAATILVQAGFIFGVSSLLDPEQGWPLVGYGILFLIQFLCIPVWIVLGNCLLSPVEALIRHRYLKSARVRISQLHPCIVGITGSYGKTSTKHLVTQVLRSKAPTLMTPGSVNTLMGVTRVIREELLPDHRYFVVEMGAYRPGSIAGLCALTPPDVAVLTEVGIAHLERFGSVEAVAQAKSELPAALPADGWLVYNSDNPYCRLIASKMKCRLLSYGKDASLATPDLWIQQAEQQADGIDLTLIYQGKRATARVPVHGLHQAHNATAAVGVGLCLGIPLLQAVGALHHAAPTPHRCAVSQRDGVTWIDDSYNSNPNGFRNALEVLRALPGERGILVTPGMIELGGAHSEEHRALARVVLETCQEVCLVAPSRIPTLKEALLEAGFEQARMHCFDSFSEARTWLLQHLRPGDKVLLENDLPDLHERSSAFEELGKGGR